MKIEQKHGTKAPAYMAVAVLLATTTLAAGCGTRLAGETTTELVLAGETETAITSSEVQLEGEAQTVCARDFYLDSSYFESVNKNYTLDQLIDEIGPCSSFGGSGMIHYNWDLDDGSQATVYFGSDGILMITVYDGEDVIYEYYKYDDSAARETLDKFFEAFAESDYEAMKAFCTESCIEDYFHDGDVNGMIWANITETENGRLKEGRWYYLVTVEMETTEDSEFAGETTASFYVILIQDEEENWFINKFVSDVDAVEF